MLLTVSSLAFSYGRRPILEDVNFTLNRGEWLTVVGPNGAGKTTLLRCLLGLLAPHAGEVRIDGQALATLSRREIARKLALLPQVGEMPFGFTVREVVAMGRTPHVGRFRPLTVADRALIEQALQATETAALADRPVTALSGGEAQRVFLARALAQDTPLLVLDEPTNNLDLFHERTLLDQVARRRDQGAAVVAVLHDLNLAVRYSDRLLVLSAGRVADLGPPEAVLTAQLIQAVFRVEPVILRDPRTQQLRILS